MATNQQLQASAKKSEQLIKNLTDMNDADKERTKFQSHTYFPYNKDFINSQLIAKPLTLPTTGKLLSGVQTKETCEMNAAKEYVTTKKLNIKNSKFVEGEFQTTTLSDGRTEIRGTLLPMDGNDNTTINVDISGDIWVNEATLTPFATNTQTKPFKVWKYVPVPFIYQSSATIAITPNIKLIRKSGSEIDVKKGIYVAPNNPVYYNYNKDTNTCVVFKGDISGGIDNVGDYQNMVLWSIPLTSKGQVGLNELGQLTIYDSSGNSVVLLGDPANSAKNKHTLILNSKTGTLTLRDKVLVRGLDTANAVSSEWNYSQIYRDSITSEQITANGKRLPKFVIDVSSALITSDNKLALTVDASLNSLLIMKRIKNGNRLYSVQPDYKMGKSFLTDANTDTKSLIWFNKNNSIISSVPASYANMYPASNNEYKITDGSCNITALTNYNHFYEVQLAATGKTQCLTPMDITKATTFNAKPANSQYANSTLFKPFRIANNSDKSDDPINSLRIDSNGFNQEGTTDFKLLDKLYKKGANLNTLMKDYKWVDEKTKQNYGINSHDLLGKPLMPVTYEGFVTQQEEVINNINNNIAPTYQQKYGQISQINRNVQDISGGLQKYRDAKDAITGTGIVNGTTKDRYYDFSGNTLYALETDRSMITALMKDRETMLTEQNNLYIVSLISVAALFIGSIVLSTSSE